MDRIKRGIRIRYGVRELTVTRTVNTAGGIEYHGTDYFTGRKTVVTVPLWDTPEIMEEGN